MVFFGQQIGHLPNQCFRTFKRSIVLAAICAMLAPMFCVAEAEAAPTFSIFWDAPTTRTDGSALTNLSGYYVYFRSPSGSYNTTNRRTVSGASQTSYTFSDLTPGVYFFAVAAFDSTGLESIRSGELNTATLRPSLEVGVVVGRNFSIRVFSPGGTSPIHVATRPGDSDQYVTIGSTTTLPSVVDVWIKTASYLAARAANVTLANVPALSSLPAGDIDDSNRVDITDAQLMNQDWFSSNARSDFDGSGRVDINDARFLSTNWFRSGVAP